LRIIRSYSAMFSFSPLAVEGLVDDNKERIADLKEPRTISRGCHRHFPKLKRMPLAPELAVIGEHIIGEIEADASATARHHEFHEAVHRCRIGPAQHGDDVVLRVDLGQVAAGAAPILALRRSARIKSASGVQPPQIAIWDLLQT
jgi:hypothetical protein